MGGGAQAGMPGVCSANPTELAVSARGRSARYALTWADPCVLARGTALLTGPRAGCATAALHRERLERATPGALTAETTASTESTTTTTRMDDKGRPLLPAIAWTRPVP